MKKTGKLVSVLLACTMAFQMFSAVSSADEAQTKITTLYESDFSTLDVGATVDFKGLFTNNAAAQETIAMDDDGTKYYKITVPKSGSNKQLIFNNPNKTSDLVMDISFRATGTASREISNLYGKGAGANEWNNIASWFAVRDSFGLSNKGGAVWGLPTLDKTKFYDVRLCYTKHAVENDTYTDKTYTVDVYMKENDKWVQKGRDIYATNTKTSMTELWQIQITNIYAENVDASLDIKSLNIYKVEPAIATGSLPADNVDPLETTGMDITFDSDISVGTLQNIKLLENGTASNIKIGDYNEETRTVHIDFTDGLNYGMDYVADLSGVENAYHSACTKNIEFSTISLGDDTFIMTAKSGTDLNAFPVKENKIEFSVYPEGTEIDETTFTTDNVSFTYANDSEVEGVYFVSVENGIPTVKFGKLDFGKQYKISLKEGIKSTDDRSIIAKDINISVENADIYYENFEEYNTGDIIAADLGLAASNGGNSTIKIGADNDGNKYLEVGDNNTKETTIKYNFTNEFTNDFAYEFSYRLKENSSNAVRFGIIQYQTAPYGWINMFRVYPTYLGIDDTAGKNAEGATVAGKSGKPGARPTTFTKMLLKYHYDEVNKRYEGSVYFPNANGEYELFAKEMVLTASPVVVANNINLVTQMVDASEVVDMDEIKLYTIANPKVFNTSMGDLDNVDRYTEEIKLYFDTAMQDVSGISVKKGEVPLDITIGEYNTTERSVVISLNEVLNAGESYTIDLSQAVSTDGLAVKENVSFTADKPDLVASEFKFYGGDDTVNTTDTIKGQTKITVKTAVENNTDSIKKVTIIAAYYSAGNKLEKVKFESYDINGNTTNSDVKAVIDEIAPAEGSSIRAFCWLGEISDVTPISSVGIVSYK